jgi:3-deoxy-D-manno-octulosonate 8-phosphate phosphatase (KDO 8-P phosphatase)
MISENTLLHDHFEKIKVLLLDVDGVLTDGRIMFDYEGRETISFNVKDGLGIRMLLESGITVGIVTGRSTPALKFRCKQLGIPLVFEGIRDKAAILEKIIKLTGVSAEQMAFIGDDLPDICLMKCVGLSIAVADAHAMCRDTADLVTGLNGGQGAVREVCEAILKAKNVWDEVLDRFLSIPA